MKQSTFMAWITRMTLIQRWGLMHCIKPENVSEHSHQVAAIAHMLAVIKKVKFNGDISPEKAATLALYHEVAETKLQDISSTTKYSNPEFTKEFKRLEALAEQECLNTLPEELREYFEPMIVQDKVDKEYQPIIKAADILSAYIKTNDEVCFHNKEFHHVKISMDKKVSELANKMPEVKYFLDVFCESCTATLDEISGMSH